MDRRTRLELVHVAEELMAKNPPRLGEGFDLLADRDRLRLRMSYQRWLLMQLAPHAMDIPMVDVVAEVVGPLMVN